MRAWGTLADLDRLFNVGRGCWYLLEDRRSTSPPFSYKAHPYIEVDGSGPAVTLRPRTKSYPRDEASAKPHARHDHCERTCRIDQPGFILPLLCSFGRDALEGRFSCREPDQRIIDWVLDA